MSNISSPPAYLTVRDLGVEVYCRICRGEYREGIDECPICGEPLTTEFPTAGPNPVVERLPAAAALAMIGTVFTILIRTAVTLNPSQSLTAARVSTILLLCSYAAIVVFFAVFVREAVDRTQWRLKIGAWAALAGCTSAAVIVALNLLILFDRPVVNSDPLGIASSIVSTLVPLTSVLFFAGFLVDHRSAPTQVLTAARFALAGAILSAAAHAVAGALMGLSPELLAQAGLLPALVGYPIVLFAFGTWLYFLWLVRSRAITTG